MIRTKKNADLVGLLISRFFRSSAFSFSVGTPVRCPLSTPAFLTQSCSVSGVQRILAAIESRRPARRMLAGVIQNHPNHTGRDLG